MSFKDRTGTSVESLLAILRSAQGDGPPQPTAGPSRTQSTSTAPAAVPSPQRPVSRNAQLTDLLAQLDESTPAAPVTPRRGSAFDGPTHGLIDPFGPVGRTPSRRESDQSPGPVVSPRTSVDKGKGKRTADDLEDKADWSFTRCLPVLTELLRDDAFVKEVRKMKSDQDALERRLWARMEKVKADCKAQHAADREIAKVLRKPIPPETMAKWDRELKAALNELFKKQVLPSFDGLTARQHARLVELGVPGLGGDVKGKGRPSDADKARAVKVKRIMGVLESVLD